MAMQSADVLRGSRRAGARLGAAVDRLRSRRRPHPLGELLIIAWLAWIYDLLVGSSPARAHLALSNAWGTWHVERAIGLTPELALNRWLAAHHSLGQLASLYYDNAHFLVTLGLLAWLYARLPDDYRRLRSALALVNVIAFAVFWLFPLAPPRMLTALGFSDVVAASGTFGQWHTGSLAAGADQFAAMPSVHVAWALWSAVVLWQLSRSRWVRALAIAYPLLTSIVIFATGNHYLLDAAGGAVAFALAWALALLPAPLLARLRATALTGYGSASPVVAGLSVAGAERSAREGGLG